MTLTQLLAEQIDTRSFASLWFWLALAGIWVMLGQRVMGVPLHIVEDARRGREAGRLVDWLALTLPDIAGKGEPLLAWLLASFTLSLAAVLGFGYGAEAGQVVFLVLAPLALVMLLRRGLARRLLALEAMDEAVLARRLLRHRLIETLIAMVSLTATGVWGLSALIRQALGGV